MEGKSVPVTEKEVPISVHTTPVATEEDLKWPSDAQLLEEVGTKPSVIAYDVILILLPLGLIAKAILVVVEGMAAKQADGNLEQVSDVVVRLEEFNGQLVTLFTIIFVTVISTLVRRFALYKAQQGATVSKLELLQSSISLPKTLTLIWSLRAFSFTGLGLTIIWSYYYIGSQAVSRELAYHDSDRPGPLTIASLNPGGPTIWEQGGPTSMILADMNADFSEANEALISYEPDKYAESYDTKGNMLIPAYIPGYYDVDKDGWLKTKEASGTFYASALGLPLLSTYRDTAYCYSSNSSCDWPTTKIIGEIEFTTSYIQPNCSEIELWKNASKIFSGVSPYVNTTINMTDVTKEAPIFQISSRYNDSALVSKCNLTETQMELKVTCTAVGCSANAARATPGKKLSSTLFYNETAANAFFNNAILAAGTPADSIESTFLDYETYDGFSGFQALLDDPELSFTWNITLAESAYSGGVYLSQGVMPIINGYMAKSQDSLFDTNNWDAVVALINGTTPSITYNVTKVHGAHYKPQYRINWIWMTLDFISCGVLLAAAALAIYIRTLTLAPDIFGYVSSLTRDNPMIGLPEGGTTMSGLERARRLRNVRVQIADVGTSDGVGRVGLTRATVQGGQNLGVLQKGRSYV